MPFIDRRRSRTRNPALAGYGAGLAAVLTAAALKLALAPLDDRMSPFSLFLGAVMVAVWFGSWGPGLATTLLAALAGALFFMPSGFPFAPAHGSALGLGLFLGEGSLISLLGAQLRAARGQANLRTERALGSLADSQKADTAAQELRAEIATLDR